MRGLFLGLVFLLVLVPFVAPQGSIDEDHNHVFGSATTDTLQTIVLAAQGTDLIDEDLGVIFQFSEEDINEFEESLNLGGDLSIEKINGLEIENGVSDYFVAAVLFSGNVEESSEEIKSSFFALNSDSCVYLYIKEEVVAILGGPPEDNLGLFNFRDGETRFKWNSMSDADEYISGSCILESESSTPVRVLILLGIIAVVLLVVLIFVLSRKKQR